MIAAKATVHEGRILVRNKGMNGETWEDLRDIAKSIPGGRWVPARKSWSYALSVDVCLALRQVYGDGLTVLPRLSEWYRAAEAQRQEQTALATTATDAELVNLPRIAPALADALRPDQRVGAAWVAEGYRGGGLVADEPGCGKTLITIAGILEADIKGPVLIACPRLSVKAVWHKEITTWTGERVYIARGTRAKRQRAIDRFMEDPAERKFLVVVGEMLRVKVLKEVGVECQHPTCELDGGPTTHRAFHDKMVLNKTEVGYEYPELFGIKWSQIVVDESHKMFGSLTVVKGTLAGRGLKAIAKQSDRRLAVTGTPFGKGGRVQGMFGTLHWLWPDEFTSFWRWAGTHFEIEEREVHFAGGRGRTRTVKNIVGLKAGIDAEQFLHTLGPRILRRTKAEVLPWLPPKQHVNVMCELSPKQVAQYKQMTEDGEIMTEDGVVTINGVLAAITRAKQLANGVLQMDEDGNVSFTGDSGKIDNMMALFDERGILDGSGDLKVIVASQYNEFLEAVGKTLEEAKVGYHLMTGATSDSKRDKMMAAFQTEGGHRVFMLNSKAGGVSVTLDAADEVHALDELWDPGDNEQLEDRAHRASRNHKVTIFHYVGEGTIDQKIAEDVEGKRFQQFATLDGRRGLEYARELIEYRRPKEDNE